MRKQNKYKLKMEVDEHPRTLKLSELLSVCVYLVEESGKLIREVHESGAFGT
jgi:hypothetical protein